MSARQGAGQGDVMRFTALIDAFEDAGIDPRDAYWARDHRDSDGSREIVLVADGREYTPATVWVDGERIIVDCVTRAIAADSEGTK